MDLGDMVKIAQGSRGGRAGGSSSPRSRRRVPADGPPSVISQVTAEGDPRFSRARAGTQAQVPAAAAQYDLLLNQNRARKVQELYAQLGLKIPEEVQQIQQSGMMPDKPGFFENVLNALDAPRRVVNLALQDISAGREEDTGLQSPDASDYWRAFMGDTEEVLLRTGHKPSSGSETLALWGWDEADTGIEKFGRGVVDFALQVFTDPLTYLTFGASAVGKKALASGADAAVQRVVKEGIEGAATTGLRGRFYSEWQTAFRQNYDNLVNKLDDAGKEALGHDTRMVQSLIDEADNAARFTVVNRARDEVIKPVVERNFGELAEEWVQELPKYATGGARIAVPFSTSLLQRGWQIPGTRGLGRKIAGEPFRRMVSFARKNGVTDKVIKTMSSVADNLDQFRPLVNAMKKKEIDGSHFAMILDAFAHSELAGRVTEAGARIGHYANKIVAATGATDAETLAKLRKGLFAMLTGKGMSDELLALAPLGSAAAKYIDEFAAWTKTTTDTFHRAMAEAAPELNFGYLQNYLPLSMTPEMRDFLTELSASPAWFDYAKAQAGGREGAGVFYLSTVLGSLGNGGRVEAAIGANRHLKKRDLDLAPIVGFHDGSLASVIDPAVLKADGFVGVVREFLSSVHGDNLLGTVELNDLMEPILKTAIEEFNLTLKVPKQGLRIFNEDPFQVLYDYTKTMSDTVMYRNMLKTLEQSGLILPKMNVLNVQATLNHITDRLNKPGVIKTLQRFEAKRKGVWASEAIKSLNAARISGELKTFAAKRRSALSRLAPADVNDLTGRWELLVLEPIDQEARATQKRFLLGPVEGKSTFEPGRMGSLIFYNPADDAYLPGFNILQNVENVEAAIGRGDLVRINFTNDRAIVTMSDKTQLIDGLEYGAVAQRKALELLHAHGFKEQVVFTTRAEGDFLVEGYRDAGSMMMSDVVRELSDDAAYLSSWDYLGRVQYGADDLTQFQVENSLMHKLAEGVRRKHKKITEGILVSENRARGLLGSDLVGDGSRVKAYWPTRSGNLNDARFDQVDEIDWNDVHGIALAYSRTTKKWYMAVAGGDEHQGAMAKIYQDMVANGEVFAQASDVYSRRTYSWAWQLENTPEISYFHGTNRPYGYTAEDAIGGLAPTRKGSFQILMDPAVEPAIADYVDSVGLWLAKKTGNRRYVATTWASDVEQRVLDVTNASWDPSLMDDVTLYEMLFDTARKMSEAEALGKLPAVVRSLPLIEPDVTQFGTQAALGATQPAMGMRLAQEATASMGQTLPAAARKYNLQRMREGMQPVGEMNPILQESMESLVRARTPGQQMQRKSVLSYFTQEYGDAGAELVAAVKHTTKEIIEHDQLEVKFMDTLSRLFNVGLDADGKIVATTRFVDNEENNVQRWLDEIQGYGESLGLKSDTFAAQRQLENFVNDPRHRNFIDPGIFNVGGPTLDSKLVVEGVGLWFEQLVKNMSSIYTPMGLSQLKESTNNVVRMWKTMTTITRPTFHIRNLIGGVWNNQIVGVRMRDYANVRSGMVKIRSALRNGKTLDEAINAIEDVGRRQTFRAAWNSGLLDLSFSRSEFRALSEAERTAMARRLGFVNPFDAENFVLAKTGALFMESIEDFMRVSAFARWFDPNTPGSEKVAKEMSLGVHFDYKHLTEFETKVKRFVPFFVWQRRNLPLQLQTMIEQPGLINRYQHLMNAANEQFADVEQDKYATSDWMSAFAIGTDIVLNDQTPFWARIMIDPDIPVKDLFELNPASPTETMEYFLNSLGPQYSFVQDFLEQKEYGPVNAPAPMNAVLSQMARAGFFDTSADGDIQWPYLLRTIYNLAFPYAQEFEDMIAPSDPRRQQQVGQAQDDTNIESVLSRLGLVLGRGLGVQTQTPSQTPGAAAKAREQLDRILGEEFRKGTIPQEVYDEVFG